MGSRGLLLRPALLQLHLVFPFLLFGGSRFGFLGYHLSLDGPFCHYDLFLEDIPGRFLVLGSIFALDIFRCGFELVYLEDELIG